MTQNWQQYTTADGILNKTVEMLTEHYDSREARNISIVLLKDLFDIDRNDILTKKTLSWDTTQYQLLETSINRLLQNEPIQHITQKSFFMGLEFIVSSKALIPRPETEELVHWIISDNPKEGLKILDIGTGSGCIAISLALKMKYAHVNAWEVENGALEVARLNVQKLNAQVSIVKMDALQVHEIAESYDIIVSNPPYIPESEKSLMHQNVLDYEPQQALFVNDNEALIFYEKIADLAKYGLNEGGKLYFEINEHKAGEVKKLLEDKGFQQIEIRKDLQGKDRMIRGIYVRM